MLMDYSFHFTIVPPKTEIIIRPPYLHVYTRICTCTCTTTVHVIQYHTRYMHVHVHVGVHVFQKLKLQIPNQEKRPTVYGVLR